MFDLQFITRVYQGVKASLLFWVYMLRGLIIYGFLPSLFALLAVMNDIRRGFEEEEHSVSSLYSEYYNKYSEYKAGSFLFSFLFVLYYTGLFFINQRPDDGVSLLLTIFVVYILALTIIVLSYGAHFVVIKQMTLKAGCIHGFLAALRNLLLSIGLLAVVFGLGYIATINFFLFIISFPALYGFAILFFLGRVAGIKK
ncbi:hypothetical protein AJ85_15560 [Alkalihalobacillus alcalophilus ATCC 27647 = CGMCC 1.3604]|uniref:DUF624 domain-containing protein n=1 Tax=Alkalihalobacillus alcalophilus ATCC 27647 = CGMCC 1.3604 TaxID=1218173 RepID=A0A094WJ54_ALKAL|nr:DUF624 domain-containing protein [Alkalihalobacillus alcalophilus]KGA97804.1 hypothetical protein BALCAV_0208230 [Alkalihalobacillus alcalophilus ATCC 27647 = CGMCC 1.3604]MED1563789.1 DUF624 domain-containing protein [Alkalihalobacillus alcalophilus]THG89716.1 hypothetical protein AJ85_15560 [Alkalihalobacillus alcalophilus ATCC 27647 = CGMCC 1.3604]